MKYNKIAMTAISFLTTFSAMAQLPPAAEKFYLELKENALKEMVTPMVQDTISDQTKVQSVVQQVGKSINMEKVKSDSWPCLSKMPESKWRSADKCFQSFIADLTQKTFTFTALANSNEKVDMNDPKQVASAIGKGSKILSDKAMSKHYANDLMMDASQIFMLTMVAGGEVSSSTAKEFRNKKIACGAKLFGQKNGTVIVEFPNKCIPMEDSHKDFTLSVEDVIKAAQRDPSYLLTCKGHKCIWKMKQ